MAVLKTSQNSLKSTGDGVLFNRSCWLQPTTILNSDPHICFLVNSLTQNTAKRVDLEQGKAILNVLLFIVVNHANIY